MPRLIEFRHLRTNALLAVVHERDDGPDWAEIAQALGRRYERALEERRVICVRDRYRSRSGERTIFFYRIELLDTQKRVAHVYLGRSYDFPLAP